MTRGATGQETDATHYDIVESERGLERATWDDGEGHRSIEFLELPAGFEAETAWPAYASSLRGAIERALAGAEVSNLTAEHGPVYAVVVIGGESLIWPHAALALAFDADREALGKDPQRVWDHREFRLRLPLEGDDLESLSEAVLADALRTKMGGDKVYGVWQDLLRALDAAGYPGIDSNEDCVGYVGEDDLVDARLLMGKTIPKDRLRELGKRWGLPKTW